MTVRPRERVVNIVATSGLSTEIDLTKAFTTLSHLHPEYEPETFPGLIIRPPALPATVLLFATGRAVLTGAADARTLKSAIETIGVELGAEARPLVIVNVVATVDLEHNIDLAVFHKKEASKTSYHPGHSLQFRSGHGTVHVSKRGKLTTAGARSTEAACEAISEAHAALSGHHMLESKPTKSSHLD